MVRVFNTGTVHHCPRRDEGGCRKPKGAFYCHFHSEVCAKHPDTAYLKRDKCPTCLQEIKLKENKERKERESGRDPVGEMKRLKKEANKAAAEEKKANKRKSAFFKVEEIKE